MTISIRRKKTLKGISLFLDYNTRTNRYEFLKLYLFDEEILDRKLTRAEKEHNREIEMKVEIIRAKRMQEFISGTFKLYGIEHKQRLESSFLAYFDKIMNERQETSESNRGNWKSARNHWVNFAGKRNIRFADIDEKLLDGFRRYLLTSHDINGIKGEGLARNSALSYFTKLRVVIKQAVKDKYLQENPLEKVKGIQPEETKREILTTDEMRKLFNTPCDDPLLKRAFLFSCLTGMRYSDVMNLKWANVQHSSDTGYFIRFRQKKTEGEDLVSFTNCRCSH
jgi:integrase